MKYNFSDEKFELLSQLRNFNYQSIYHNEQMCRRQDAINHCIGDLFAYFRKLFQRYQFDYEGYQKERKLAARGFGNYIKSMNRVYKEDAAQINTIISDYIAGMTDSFALSIMQEVILPTTIDFFN